MQGINSDQRMKQPASRSSAKPFTTALGGSPPESRDHGASPSTCHCRRKSRGRQTVPAWTAHINTSTNNVDTTGQPETQSKLSNWLTEWLNQQKATAFMTYYVRMYQISPLKIRLELDLAIFAGNGRIPGQPDSRPKSCKSLSSSTLMSDFKHNQSCWYTIYTWTTSRHCQKLGCSNPLRSSSLQYVHPSVCRSHAFGQYFMFPESI